MLELHDPGRRDPHTDATVRGGILVSARRRADVVALLDACADIVGGEAGWQPAPAGARDDLEERRFRRLYGRLMAGDLSGDADAAAPSAATQRRIERLLADPRRDRFDTLMLGLATLLDAWDDDRDDDRGGDEPSDLRAWLALGRPGDAPAAEVVVTYGAARAGLALWPGSLVAGLSVTALVKGARWCMGVVGAVAGKSPQRAIHELVEHTRDRARAANCQYDVPRLDRLTDAERQELESRRLVVVLLHGLCSTDLLTFDGWIAALLNTNPHALLQRLSTPSDPPREATGVVALHDGLQAALADAGDDLATVGGATLARFVHGQVGWVGWPHDTLTGIEENARALYDLIDASFDPASGPKLVFVCHSRGGLVARAVAAKLLERSTPAHDWVPALLDLCTFGTPHDGAAIAEASTLGAREFATYLLMFGVTRRLASLSNVLAVLDARTAEGIENLKPAGAVTADRAHAYVSDLYDREAGLRRAGGSRHPPLTAIGGRIDATVRSRWQGRAAAALIERKLGHADHDLVVERSSTVSSRARPQATMTVASDHFGYFDRDGDAARGIDLTLARLWTHLGPALAPWAAARAQARVAPPRAIFPKPFTLVSPPKTP
ncbi:MAG: hypothetical protein ABIX46_01635 [Burkholderiaceae bacterium]